MHPRWKPIFSIATCAVLVLASSCSKKPPTAPTPASVGQVTPSPLAFGLVTVDGRKDRSFTIKNTGGGTLSGSVGAGAGAFTVVAGGGSYALTAGQERSVTVRFAPTATGVQQYALTLGSSATPDLACTGTGTPVPVTVMVLVPAGEFTMGSTAGGSDEQPVHAVTLGAFYIDKYEVTNAQFQQFIDAGGYTTQALWSAEGWAALRNSGRTEPYSWTSGTYHSGTAWPDFPVVGVSWYEAEAYANYAGKRLPTEAEWEKAARGTDQRTYPWGEDLDASRANYFGGGNPFGNISTPVGFYDGRLHPSPPFQTTDSPSPYGAYDMAGNVWEWVADWYQADYYSASPLSDPPGPPSGTSRVLRGASWKACTMPDYPRSTRRLSGNPAGLDAFIGFRCAKTVP